MKLFTTLRSAVGSLRPNYGLLALFAVIGCVSAIAPAHGMLIGVGLTTLTATNPTLLDLAKALDPNGVVADIVEIQNETNEILQDMTFQEGNLLTGHQSNIRTGIPTPTWRKYYGTVQPTKSTNVAVTDTCGMLEDYARVDKALAELNGNSSAFRLSEDRAHLEGFAQKIAATVIYGNESTTPESFSGLAPRFSTVTVATAESADNVIDHGGTGSDNTSAWLVCWSPRTVFGIVPKGSKAGIQARDLGEQMIQESTGSWQALVTHYRQDVGLCVRDWRYVARVCNIDVSDLGTIANTKAIINSMIMAAERIPSFGGVRPVWYVNRTIREKLRLGILEKIANNLTWETVAGQGRVMMFDGIPVRRVDEILNTEARVV